MSNDLDNQSLERKSFKDFYFKTIADAGDILIENTPHLQDAPTKSSNITRNTALPIINLPKFNWSEDKWVSFRDIFKSLIHEDKSFNFIQKFHYLELSLSDEAAHVIRS